MITQRKDKYIEEKAKNYILYTQEGRKTEQYLLQRDRMRYTIKTEETRTFMATKMEFE